MTNFRRKNTLSPHKFRGKPGTTLAIIPVQDSMTQQCEKESVEIDVESLNDLQLEAVEAPFESPLLVLAGPGTGKTRVIVERIKNMVKNGIEPSEILCLHLVKKQR